MGQKDFLTAQIKDAALFAIGNQSVVYIDFLESSLQMLTEREIARYPGSDCEFWGGHEYCERKMLAVFPEGENPSTTDFPIDCVQMNNPSTDITHQDVLGALMGLGIERDKTGDINITSDLIQLFVSSPLGEFVTKELTKISRYEVDPKLVKQDKIIVFEPTFQELDLIVPSLRADAIIHTAYKVSRNEAAALIKAEKVKVDHIPIKKPAANLKLGSTISVRSKGKFILDSQNGVTKKGNLKIRIKKFT